MDFGAFVNNNLLTLVTFSPLVGSVLLLLAPRGTSDKVLKWVAFLWSLVPLGLGIVLWTSYNPYQPGFQFELVRPWFPQINSSFHLGVDGISVSMVLLTTLLTPLALLISFNIREDLKAYLVLFLMLEMGMLGVFVALDLVLFFIFWEFGLVPMYFLINKWGGKERVYASFKFFIYTMAGSLGLLLAIQCIRIATGTFDIVQLTTPGGLPFAGAQVLSTSFISPELARTIAFWAFVLAFAIKVPVWPFHTWLPDAHTEAPTAGSMILAGVLLKLGAYGFLRLVLPLFPAEAARFAPVLAFFGMLAVVLGAFAALGQVDFKKLVAYSSVNHMGFVVLGIAAAAYALGPSTGEKLKTAAVIATNGAVLQMFNHGLSAAAMFALVGVVYDRAHTRDLRELGGLGIVVPAYGAFLMYNALASLGLPGLNGFVSEFMVVRGVWPIFTLFTALAMVGLLLTGAYILYMIAKVLVGPLNEKWASLPEINWREGLALAPLMVLMLVIGVYPLWIVEVINATVVRLLG
jgi:NADH-quinone oxidoreductase subunit M